MQNLAVVHFPKVSSGAIDEFRQKYDPSWQIIPPHITLVSPLTDISEALLRAHLETITQGIHSFPIVLRGLLTTADHHLFLQVQEGNDEIIHVHDKLYSGVLASHKPTEIPFVPHITLGYFGKENGGFNNELYAKAYDEAEKINIHAHSSFDKITLIKGDGLSQSIILGTFKLI